jgi:hypothetical protein
MVRPTWLTETVLKWILGALLVLAVVLWFRLWLHGHDKEQAEKARVEFNDRTSKATGAILDNGSEEAAGAQEQEDGVRQAGATFEDRYEGGVRNDATAADRAARPVPEWVRDAYRQRRLERERLAGSRDDRERRARAEEAR